MICPECGKKLPDDAGFCVRCGANQNNVNAEIYKKTKSAQSVQKDDGSHTRVMNIIPDDNIQKDNSENDENKVIAENFGKSGRTKPVPSKKYDEPEEKDEDDDDDETEYDDDDSEESEKSSKLAVISVVCVCLIAVCIIVYFFTTHQASGNNTSSIPDVTSQTAVQTTVPEETTAPETSETTEAPETTIVTDSMGNEYEIEFMDSIEATVNVDEGNLRLRAYPSTEVAILGEIQNGTQITVVGSCGDWYYVLDGERKGYVFSDYVTLNVSETSAEETSEISESISETEETSASESVSE